MNPDVFLMQQICSFWWDILDMLTFCKYNLPIASDLCAFFRFLVLRFGNSHSGTFRLSWRCLTCWATAPKLHKLTRQPNFHWTSKNLREYTWNQLQSLAITCILQAHSTSCCLEWCWAAGVGAKKSQAATTWRVSVFFLQPDTKASQAFATLILWCPSMLQVMLCWNMLECCRLLLVNDAKDLPKTSVEHPSLIQCLCWCGEARLPLTSWCEVEKLWKVLPSRLFHDFVTSGK